MPSSREGERVPSVSFPTRIGTEWKTINSDDLFRGKTVVLFALPGAFTPTCSTAHVPRYNQLQPQFLAKGVDEIVCLSVNDTFVMNAWQQEQGADRVRFVADGNGEFSERMGMLVDKSQIGFGKRSWRYSMLVRDGVIEKMFVEPEREGDPYEVSDADTMLEYLGGKAPPEVILFTRPHCGFCTKAKRLLDDRGIAYSEVPATPAMLRAVSGRKTTPQVFIDGRHVGGADDLEQHLASK
jgi:peroxiredoxin/glutaredoxin